MAAFARDEVEAAFRVYWRTGAVEEDYWVPAEAMAATKRYQEACAKHDPEHPQRRTRRRWTTERRSASPGPRR